MDLMKNALKQIKEMTPAQIIELHNDTFPERKVLGDEEMLQEVLDNQGTLVEVASFVKDTGFEQNHEYYMWDDSFSNLIQTDNIDDIVNEKFINELTNELIAENRIK